MGNFKKLQYRRIKFNIHQIHVCKLFDVYSQLQVKHKAFHTSDLWLTKFTHSYIYKQKYVTNCYLIFWHIWLKWVIFLTDDFDTYSSATFRCCLHLCILSHQMQTEVLTDAPSITKISGLSLSGYKREIMGCVQSNLFSILHDAVLKLKKALCI